MRSCIQQHSRDDDESEEHVSGTGRVEFRIVSKDSFLRCHIDSFIDQQSGKIEKKW